MNAFMMGAAAGLAIAVPVGAIAVLIVDRAARYGWPTGAAAALGAASADVTYALVAITVGASVARMLAPYQRPFALVGGTVLAVIGVRLLVSARRLSSASPADTATSRAELPTGRTFRTGISFYLLTLANPLTIVYFTILASSLANSPAASRLAFAAGAGSASAGWQLLLATTASAIGSRIQQRFGVITGWAGGLAVIVLAVRTFTTS